MYQLMMQPWPEVKKKGLISLFGHCSLPVCLDLAVGQCVNCLVIVLGYDKAMLHASNKINDYIGNVILTFYKAIEHARSALCGLNLSYQQKMDDQN